MRLRDLLTSLSADETAGADDGSDAGPAAGTGPATPRDGRAADADDSIADDSSIDALERELADLDAHLADAEDRLQAIRDARDELGGGDGAEGRTSPDATGEAAAAADRFEGGGDRATGAAPDDGRLDSLADTYAADVLAYEWLSDLVVEAGPAAALKAIAHYESIGWIGPDARRDLEAMLAGPDLDIYVDPREPRDLSADAHARSYAYVLRLRAVGRLVGDR